MFQLLNKISALTISFNPDPVDRYDNRIKREHGIVFWRLNFSAEFTNDTKANDALEFYKHCLFLQQKKELLFHSAIFSVDKNESSLRVNCSFLGMFGLAKDQTIPTDNQFYSALKQDLNILSPFIELPEIEYLLDHIDKKKLTSENKIDLQQYKHAKRKMDENRVSGVFARDSIFTNPDNKRNKVAINPDLNPINSSAPSPSKP